MFQKLLLGVAVVLPLSISFAQESEWDNRKIPVVSVSESDEKSAQNESAPDEVSNVTVSGPSMEEVVQVVPEASVDITEDSVAGEGDLVKDYFDKEQGATSRKIVMEPGDSRDISVAKNMLNVISTNFHEVVVLTGNSGDIVKEGGDLYVVLEGEAPVGLILMEKGVPDSQVLLTLVPERALPSHIDLSVTMASDLVKKGEDYRIGEEAKVAEDLKAGHQGESQYESYLNGLLVSLAKGTVPRSYIYKSVPVAMRKPVDVCKLHVFSEKLQEVEGKDYVIDVYRVVNDLEMPYEVVKQDCYAESVRAVGLFPHSKLNVGEETELYIVREKAALGKKRSVRPSALNRG